MMNHSAVTVRGVLGRVDIRGHRNRRGAVAEIKDVLARPALESTGTKHDGITRLDPERRRIRGVHAHDRGGAVSLRPLIDAHQREVVVGVPCVVRHRENLAVRARPRISPSHRGAVRRRAVAQRPRERAHALLRPRARSVERHFSTHLGRAMRPGDGNQRRIVLIAVRLPKERIRVLHAPLARRLHALDVEMQMRPAAAAAVLADVTEALAHLHASTWLQRGIDDVEMGVTVGPTAAVDHVDDIVTRLRRRMRSAGRPYGADGYEHAVRSGHDFREALSGADVHAGVIINFPIRSRPARNGFVGKPRGGTEPPLLDRINKRPPLDPRRVRRPEPHACRLLQFPPVETRVGRERGHRRRIDLHAARLNRQLVVATAQRDPLAVHLERDRLVLQHSGHRFPGDVDLQQLNDRRRAVA